MPASIQLERLSHKLAKWHQTQDKIQSIKSSSPTNFKHFLEQKEKKLNQVTKRREAYIKENCLKKVKEKHEAWETKCNAQRKENRTYERNQMELSIEDQKKTAEWLAQNKIRKEAVGSLSPERSKTIYTENYQLMKSNEKKLRQEEALDYNHAVSDLEHLG